jgi:hypothetical protein
MAPMLNADDNYLLAWKRACKTAELDRATTSAAGHPELRTALEAELGVLRILGRASTEA